MDDQSIQSAQQNGLKERLTENTKTAYPFRYFFAQVLFQSLCLEPAPMAAVRAYVQLCRERGCDPAVVALAWVGQQPGVAAAIFGVRNEAQLRHNLAAGELQIDDGLAVQLDRIFRSKPRSRWKRWLKRLLGRS